MRYGYFLFALYLAVVAVVFNAVAFLAYQVVDFDWQTIDWFPADLAVILYNLNLAKRCHHSHFTSS